MEMTYFTLILCAAVLVGLGLPGLIYFSARKKKGVNEFDVFSRMMQKYRQAWTADQDEMQELSRRVEMLQGKGTREPESAVEAGSSEELPGKDEPGIRS
jgi:hypothetical protein